MDQATQAGPSSRIAVPDGIPGMLLSALPGGWRIAGRCRFGTGGPVGPASGCHALVHPSIGVALVDVAPDATPNAEARLRRALAAADFWQSFPGTLPVWHGRIEIGAVRSLPALLAEGFGTLPPLTVPGKEGWIAALRAALAEDSAWEVPGRASRPVIPAPPMDPEEDEAEKAPRRRRRWPVLLGGSLAAGLVLVLGLALLGEAPERSAPQVVASVAPQVQPSAAPRLVAPPPPAVEPVQAQPISPPPSLPPIERVTLVAPPPPAPRVEEPAPVAQPAVVKPEPPAVPVYEEASLALPPPAPPPAPPLRRVAPPRIDPGCTRALYRYQQGLALNATDAAHVRDGCATRR